MPDQYDDRKRLTFEQAEGAEPLPAQLRLKEVSQELRALLWAIFHSSLISTVDPYSGQMLNPWGTILSQKHVLRDHRMADEFVSDAEVILSDLKQLFTHGDYIQLFGFIQWVLRHRNKPQGLEKAVEAALRTARAAYTVVDGNTIMPVGSDAERQTIERTFADLAAKEFQGARAHIRNAGSELTAGRYASSIRESIHAVEAVARLLVPTVKTLDPALARLERSIRIHPALRNGFGNLYGFTSDEKGIRHALLEGAVADVDETDALYMLGSCAAFVSYLINKARSAGLLTESEE